MTTGKAYTGHHSATETAGKALCSQCSSLATHKARRIVQEGKLTFNNSGDWRPVYFCETCAQALATAPNRDVHNLKRLPESASMNRKPRKKANDDQQKMPW